jgi:hypothetical protein
MARKDSGGENMYKIHLVVRHYRKSIKKRMRNKIIKRKKLQRQVTARERAMEKEE